MNADFFLGIVAGCLIEAAIGCLVMGCICAGRRADRAERYEHFDRWPL